MFTGMMLLTGCENKKGDVCKDEIVDVYMQSGVTEKYCYDEYTNHIEITGYRENEDVIEIPSQINGKKLQ